LSLRLEDVETPEKGPKLDSFGSPFLGEKSPIFFYISLLARFASYRDEILDGQAQRQSASDQNMKT